MVSLSALLCRNSNTKGSQLNRSVRIHLGRTASVPPAKVGPDQVLQCDLAFQGDLVLIPIVSSNHLVEKDPAVKWVGRLSGSVFQVGVVQGKI